MNLENLYFLREENDMTQNDLAKILNVSRVSISQWENNKEIIPLNKLNQCSNYFDVSLDYLLNLSKTKQYKIINKNIDPIIVGKRLIELRNKLNYTQSKLANELNTSHSTISAYESGKVLIKTSFAYQICIKHYISMDWLCGKIL